MPKVVRIKPDSPDDKIIKETVQCLRNGGIIIYPTETFYGIGALFTNKHALKRLFQIKQRSAAKPVLLLIPDFSFIIKISPSVSPALQILSQHFWPGPLTLLVEALPHISPLVTGPDKKVGIRISNHPVAEQMLDLLQNGITSTSANLSGDASPARIEDIPDALLRAVDLVIDGGKTPGKTPSTVFDISSEPFKLVREGAISLAEITEALKSTE